MITNGGGPRSTKNVLRLPESRLGENMKGWLRNCIFLIFVSSGAAWAAGDCSSSSYYWECHSLFKWIDGMNDLCRPTLSSVSTIGGDGNPYTVVTENCVVSDPGSAGKSTLIGIDADRDGVRDDVERAIFFAYPLSGDVNVYPRRDIHIHEMIRYTLYRLAESYQYVIVLGQYTWTPQPSCNDPFTIINTYGCGLTQLRVEFQSTAWYAKCLQRIAPDINIDKLLLPILLNTIERNEAFNKAEQTMRDYDIDQTFLLQNQYGCPADLISQE